MPVPADGYAGDLTPQEAWQMLTGSGEEDAQLVDVRTAAEWAYVGVPDLGAGRDLYGVEWVTYPSGAANPEFLTQLESYVPDRSTPVVFLCRSGVRSVGAARAATAAGYQRAYNILDGFEGGLDEAGHRGVTGWRADGLPWRQG